MAESSTGPRPNILGLRLTLSPFRPRKDSIRTSMNEVNTKRPSPSRHQPNNNYLHPTSNTTLTPRSVSPNKSPTSGDRFIASRRTTNFEFSSHRLSPSKDKKPDSKLQNSSLFRDFYENTRVLNFRGSPREKLPEEQYIQVQSVRRIPSFPETVLDAPNLPNNFFVGAIDWSKKGVMVAALGSEVYLHDPTSKKTTNLPEADRHCHDYEVTGVRWNGDGSLLAVASNLGLIKIWTWEEKLQSTICMPNCYITSMVWNGDTLLSGDTSGSLAYHCLETNIKNTLKLCSDIICGLSWSQDMSYLACGTDQGSIYIFRAPNLAKPMKTIRYHKAAVKALSWCPWRNILASGGGIFDHKLCLWNINETAPISVVTTGSQICDLVFSETYRELATSHSVPDFVICLWSVPDLRMIGKLLGHSDRVLSICLSPKKSHLCSASADETIRVWNCFPPLASSSDVRSPLRSMHIR